MELAKRLSEAIEKRGNLAKLHKFSEINRRTIECIAQGKTKNPGYFTVQKLEKALAQLESEQPAETNPTTRKLTTLLPLERTGHAMATQKTGRKTIAGILPNLTDNRELVASIHAVFGKMIGEIIRDQKRDPSTFYQLAYVLWSVRGVEETERLLKTDLNTIAHARAYAASTNYNILKFRRQAGELLKAA